MPTISKPFNMEGKFWPTTQDRTPVTVIYHVPTNPLFEQVNPDEPLTRSFNVTESQEAVSERLKDGFPIYRLASALGFVSSKGAEV